jgi:hypothetical protein
MGEISDLTAPCFFAAKVVLTNYKHFSNLKETRTVGFPLHVLSNILTHMHIFPDIKNEKALIFRAFLGSFRLLKRSRAIFFRSFSVLPTISPTKYLFFPYI